MNNIVNISGYKFVALPESELEPMREDILPKAVDLGIEGTIILSPEGINIQLAGTKEAVDRYTAILRSYDYFSDVWLKESLSGYIPFEKMRVKIKKYIIPVGSDDIDPEHEPAPFLSPEQFKKWYEEGREMIILDTRKPMEIEYGKFENAIDLNLNHFRGFNEAVDQLLEKYKDKPIVTYCTGGVRCEKAAPLMLKKGFKEVYQLEGGIINYFERVGGDHWEGSCYVFDERVAVDPNLDIAQIIK